jgi:hypothetical protein
MRKFRNALLICTIALFSGGTAFGVTAAQIDEFNRFMGPIAYKHSLGSLLDTATTVVTGDITDGTILAADFAAGAVDTAAILDGTILNADVDAAAAIDPSKLLQPTADGLNIVKVARASFVCTTNCDVDTGIVSGVNLPINAVIIRSYIRVTTQFVDGGAGTIALSCEDANNIKTATDISGSADGAFIEGASTGTAATFVAALAATCDITLTSSGAEPSAGALTVWVHYVVHD